jgi:hypothetical protein
VLGDVASPLKMVLRPIYRPLERYWSQAIYKWFGCEDTAEVHVDVAEADLTLLRWEQRDLMPDTPWWPASRMAGYAPLEPWSPNYGREKFIELFHELTDRKVYAA